MNRNISNECAARAAIRAQLVTRGTAELLSADQGAAPAGLGVRLRVSWVWLRAADR